MQAFGGAASQLTAKVTSPGDITFYPGGVAPDSVSVAGGVLKLSYDGGLGGFIHPGLIVYAGDQTDVGVAAHNPGQGGASRLLLHADGSIVLCPQTPNDTIDNAAHGALVLNGVLNSTNYTFITSAITGATPQIGVFGSVDADVSLNLVTKGAGLVLVNGVAIGGSGTISFPLSSAGDQTFQPDGIANSTLTLQNAASAATGLKISGKAAGGSVNLAALSSNSNETLVIDAKGSGQVNLASNSTGQVSIAGNGLTVTGPGGLVVTGSAEVDNGLNVTAGGAAITGAVTMSSTLQVGGAISIGSGGLQVKSAGNTNSVTLQAGNNSVIVAAGVASAVNQLNVSNSATGNPIVLSSTGSNSSIDINVTPKGSGVVRVPSLVVTTTATVPDPPVNATDAVPKDYVDGRFWMSVRA